MENDALEAETALDRQMLTALLWATENSRDSYASDRSDLASAARQFDDSSPVLYKAKNYLLNKAAETAYMNDYDSVIQLIRSQIES